MKFINKSIFVKRHSRKYFDADISLPIIVSGIALQQQIHLLYILTFSYLALCILCCLYFLNFEKVIIVTKYLRIL